MKLPLGFYFGCLNFMLFKVENISLYVLGIPISWTTVICQYTCYIHMLLFLSMSCRTISMWFLVCVYMFAHCMLAFICMWVLSFTSSFVDVPYTCHTICIQQICYVYIVYVSLKYISFNGKALNSKTHLLDQYGWKVWSQIHTSDVFYVLKKCIINFI